MTLRCIYCGRALKAASAWTLGKPIGPQCARRAGVRARPVRPVAQHAAEVDARQMQLELPA